MDPPVWIRMRTSSAIAVPHLNETLVLRMVSQIRHKPANFQLLQKLKRKENSGLLKIMKCKFLKIKIV